jgi:hypothetical protein
MAKRCIGTVLALTLLGSAGVAGASTRSRLFRTDQQAAHYLEYGLQSWANNDLGRPDLRAAFCISGYSARPKANRRNPQRRVNGLGNPVYRTFACTLNAVVAGHTQVFGLYLATKPGGWVVTALD